MREEAPSLRRKDDENNYLGRNDVMNMKKIMGGEDVGAQWIALGYRNRLPQAGANEWRPNI